MGFIVLEFNKVFEECATTKMRIHSRTVCNCDPLFCGIYYARFVTR